jgi:hypothetical protein
MTIFEAERNLGELARFFEKDRELATHYQDLHDAIYELDTDKIGEILFPSSPN